MRVFIVLLSLVACISSARAEGYIIGYDETKSLFVNQTMMTYDRAHGTQVEYLSKGGKTYLFYPGNKQIVKGQWKLERTAKPQLFNLCFRYPTNSYNPATGQSGGGWDCQIAGFYIVGIKDHAQGDVLGLSKSTEVPFVLDKRQTKLSALIRKLKQ